MTEPLDPEMIICDCSGTTVAKVTALIDEGHDLDMISRKTGAFSGCGGCEYDLQMLYEAHQSKPL